MEESCCPLDLQLLRSWVFFSGCVSPCMVFFLGRKGFFSEVSVETQQKSTPWQRGETEEEKEQDQEEVSILHLLRKEEEAQ